MTLLASLLVAGALAAIGFVAARGLLDLGKKYEEDYLAKAGTLLNSLQVSISPKLVWKASVLTSVLGVLLGVATTGGWILSMVFGVAGALIPLGYLKWLKRRRAVKFQEQLPDLIGQVRTGVACGYTLPLALALAQRQLPAPASQELRAVQGHLRLGISVADALARLQQRMPSEDLDLFIGAITLAERSGGQLGKTLFGIEQTIRDRIRLERKLRTMTARGRMEAWLLALGPAALGAGMYALNPGLMDRFFQHPIGIPLMVAGGFWMMIGTFVIRKILTPQF